MISRLKNYSKHFPSFYLSQKKELLFYNIINNFFFGEGLFEILEFFYFFIIELLYDFFSILTHQLLDVKNMS